MNTPPKKRGNVLPLDEIPEGTVVCNVGLIEFKRVYRQMNQFHKLGRKL